jgi:hypothetical protein
MDQVDRRKFLKQAGVATAAGGAAVVMPASFAGFLGGGAAGATPVSHTAGPDLPSGANLDQPVVAYLRDLKTGEISLFKGDRHVSIRDKHLAARLFNAAS